MTELGRVIDLRGLPREVAGRRASIVLGMVLFVVIEATVVATLLTSYHYVRVVTRGSWPPVGVELPDLVQPIASASALVMSLGAAILARAAHRRKQPPAFRSAVAVGGVLLVVHLGLAVHELLSLPFDWKLHVYGSLVWTLSGYQILHAIALLLLAAGVSVLGSRPRGLPRDAAMTVLLVYWVFVVAASLPSYFTIYVTPHLS